MESLRFTVSGLLLLVAITSGLQFSPNRCKVSNLPFQRHVDLKKYVGRYIHIKRSNTPTNFNIRTIAKLVSPDTLATFFIGRNADSGKCEGGLILCQQVKPPGPRFNFTFYSFDGNPTITTQNNFVARTNYLSYIVFYRCIEKNYDGTCKTPNVVVESKWNDHLSRRDRMAVKDTLRRLCVDESQFFGIQQGPSCPEPEDIRYVPFGGPRREDRHRHRY